MAYEARPLRRQKVRYDDANDDNPIKTQLVIDGAKISPNSATITIYKPGNATALVTAQAMTVSGSLITYAVDTTTETSWPIQQGYRADIVVTYGGKAHQRTVIFDVEKYPLVLNLGRDQLIAIDDTLRGMDHAGDEDFSEPIEATFDHIQLLLESKATQSGQLQSCMILDNSRIAIPAAYLALSKVFFAKDAEKSARYKTEFSELFEAMLAGIKYDIDQSGEEETAQGGGIQSVRLVM